MIIASRFVAVYSASMTTSPHSAEFIAEMTDRLRQEKEQLQARLAEHAHKTDGMYEGNFPDYERDEEANAMESADYVAVSATTEVEEKRLKEVTTALKRIEDGIYGVTLGGETIPEGRLRANPAATTTVTST